MKLRLILWFLLAQIVVCGFVYRDALWGGSLLAPLDIAPALFPKYRYLDPNSSGIPANHYTIDQLTYDLPLQHTIYESLRQGEIPWWDAYNFAGRPLESDAHINGTDPIRCLLYLSLPFEAAYNWTRILHSVLTGLGMLLLLHRAGFRPGVCLPLALAYQFAGCHALYFGHTWLESSFIYYPFLWLAWDEAVHRCRWRGTAQASVCLALIYYSGNLQSHAYVVIFGLVFLAGQARFNWREWLRWSPLLLGTGLAGACLAAPVLTGQLEFYLISIRRSSHLFHPLSVLAGPGSLTAVYPWCLGTFRTLDLSKFFGHAPLGFSLFIGSTAFVLAALGALRPLPRPEWRALKWTALVACSSYLLIISTPLVNIFYMRSAAMAVMGLIVLAAIGLETLSTGGPWVRRVGWCVLTGALVVALVSNVFAWFVYPKIQDQVHQAVTATTGRIGMMGAAPKLRAFQVDNLPNEISFANPEPLLAVVGLLGLSVLLLSPKLRARSSLWCALLFLNVAPVLWFTHRFIPHQPVALWRELLAGGPEQRRVMAQMRDTPLRLWEIAPTSYDQLFPYALSHLYHVRTVHGYSALQPHSLDWLPSAEKDRWREQMADWIYESPVTGLDQGQFRPNATPGLARFQWADHQTRKFQVEDIGMNTIRVTFQPGDGPAQLLWTDTWYPGWQASVDGQPVLLEKVEPTFSRVEIASAARTLVLHFEPRFLPLGKKLVLVGALLAFLSCVWLQRHRKQRDAIITS